MYTLNNDIRVIGPGAGKLSIEGVVDVAGMLGHLGGGTMTIEGVTLRGGRKYDHADSIRGGCILSNGSVVLVDTALDDCIATTSAPDGIARGGGISAVVDVTLIRSVITDSVAENASVVGGHGRGTANAQGGAIHAGRTVTLIDSLLADNYTLSTSGVGAGGATLSTNLSSSHSVVAFNVAAVAGAALRDQ